MRGKGGSRKGMEMTQETDKSDAVTTAIEASDPGLQDGGASKAVAPAGDESAQPDAGSSEEIGGPQGPEPTRYGDWERKGRCIDF